MRGDMVLHFIHVAGTQIIESGIDGLYRGDKLVGIMRGLKTLQFVPLYQGAVARSAKF